MGVGVLAKAKTPTVIEFSTTQNMTNRVVISVDYCIVRLSDKERSFSDKVALFGQCCGRRWDWV